jgi:hypothetical protein
MRRSTQTGREELFVVLPLDRPFRTILVDAVKVEQRCARRPLGVVISIFPEDHSHIVDGI